MKYLTVRRSSSKISRLKRLLHSLSIRNRTEGATPREDDEFRLLEEKEYFAEALVPFKSVLDPNREVLARNISLSVQPGEEINLVSRKLLEQLNKISEIEHLDDPGQIYHRFDDDNIAAFHGQLKLRWRGVSDPQSGLIFENKYHEDLFLCIDSDEIELLIGGPTIRANNISVGR